MKKAIRTGIIVGCLGLLFLAVSARESRAQNVLGEVLRRMDVYSKSLTSLQAEVTMVKFDSTLKIPDTYNGSVSYLPKGNGHDRYARIDWTKPQQESLSVIGDAFELYRPKLNQVVFGKSKDAKQSGKAGNLLSLLTMKKDDLKRDFDIAYIGQEQIQGGVDTWHLELTPKTTMDYKKADLWVDADGSPRQVRVLEKNNDTTTILISAIKKNPTLKGSIFKLDYPKNAKKVPA